eukprot:SAG22_NODE_1122_length_5500_cov_2.968339_3_plen_210_part_00
MTPAVQLWGVPATVSTIVRNSVFDHVAKDGPVWLSRPSGSKDVPYYNSPVTVLPGSQAQPGGTVGFSLGGLTLENTTILYDLDTYGDDIPEGSLSSSQSGRLGCWPCSFGNLVMPAITARAYNASTGLVGIRGDLTVRTHVNATTMAQCREWRAKSSTWDIMRGGMQVNSSCDPCQAGWGAPDTRKEGVDLKIRCERLPKDPRRRDGGN